jgi:antitoxin (DNA-binding transcriptional repressor) of toxin-antitoxin stability system
MKAVNVHEAKTGFSKLLAEIEQRGSRFVICRNGQPVADLVPHQAVNRLQPDKKLGALRIKYDPVEELAPADWPLEAR